MTNGPLRPASPESRTDFVGSDGHGEAGEGEHHWDHDHRSDDERGDQRCAGKDGGQEDEGHGDRHDDHERPTADLWAISAATAVVHLLSVAVGAALGAALPTDAISIAAGVAFLAFAVWTIRGDELDDDDQARAARGGRSVFFTVAGAFFLAELGDKTMLATITLATHEGWFGTWIGSTLGMVAADALAIVVGAALGRKLPEKAIKYGAAALFAIFGVLLIASGAGWL